MLPSVTEVEIDREIVGRQGLRGFIECSWPEVESVPFVDNWHIGCLAEHLEAQTNGEIRFLVITIPPGCMKSLSVCVFWPVWEWGPRGKPGTKWIFGSYGQRLSQRDAIRHRNLIDSPWFRERWPGVEIPYQNTRSAMDFANSRGGWRFSTTVKGGVTGRHADRLVVDDPTKPQDTTGSRAAMGTELDNVIDWYGTTLSTRQADPKTTTQTIIMQRLHERDLAGHVLDQGGFVHLNLPMEYESKHHCTTVISGDQRTVEGELLWEARYPKAEVDRLKKSLGSVGTASQLQQRPSPAGGAIFKEQWFKFWGHPASEFPTLPTKGNQLQAWDFAFKGKPTGGKKRSYTCGQAWLNAFPNFFLLGQERDQVEFVGALRLLYKLSAAFPKAYRKLIEDAANGPAIVSVAKKKLSGLKLVSPGGGSVARAEAVSVFVESGNVYLPHPNIAPWVDGLIAELLAFPMGANDDQVDCLTHALVEMTAGAGAIYAQAMAELGQR